MADSLTSDDLMAMANMKITDDVKPKRGRPLKAKAEAVPAPTEAVPAPTEAVPAPTEAVSAPVEAVPAPAEAVPAPKPNVFQESYDGNTRPVAKAQRQQRIETDVDIVKSLIVGLTIAELEDVLVFIQGVKKQMKKAETKLNNSAKKLCTV